MRRSSEELGRMNGVTTLFRPSLSLRDPGAILLISCYELGHQPLGLAIPLSLLHERGFHPAAVDLSLDDLDAEAVSRARFVGVSVPMHTALRIGAEASRQIRECNPSCHICFFGLYASLNSKSLLSDAADSCIGEPYLNRLPDLVQDIESGSNDPLPGVEYRSIRSQGKPGPISASTPSDSARPTIPFVLPTVTPSREMLPDLCRYARLALGEERRIAGYVEATRGCLHLCRHCPIPPVHGGRFKAFPRELVLEDARRQIRAGAEHLTFGDPDFLNGPTHSLAIVRQLHMEFPDVTWDCTTKIEHILKRRSLIPELGENGCIFIISAVESLSPRVLAVLDKGHSRDDVAAALVVLRAAGIPMRPTLVPFTPWTTMADYLDLFSFIEDEALIDHVDPVQFTIRLLIPPGSLLLETAEMQPFLGTLDDRSFSYAWSHSDPRMDRLATDASSVVERASANGQDPTSTFYELWELAARTAGTPIPNRQRSLSSNKAPVPRLTEPWFCCAEPTQSQFRSLLRKPDAA